MSTKTHTSAEDIRSRLRSLRMLRAACHFPWLAVIIVGLIYAVLPSGRKALVLPAYQFLFFWAAAGFFLSYLIRRFPCPRCGERFHYRRPGQRFLSLYPYNDFASKCMDCGLKLNGSNA
ncbi:MAG: hypothetical protein OEO84_14995 [Betaproteobacteria bacterium]|nr:hypothetical protein [Betaproteobacteria bacterium]